MTPGMLRVFGLLVIAHGLSHAVLALQDGLTGTLWTDAVPLGLYAIGMVGFVSAGLGLMRVAPFNAAISPLLVLASGLSLIAIVRFADPQLGLVATCDVLLLVIGLWRAHHGWPDDGGIFPELRKNPQISPVDSAKTQ